MVTIDLGLHDFIVILESLHSHELIPEFSEHAASAMYDDLRTRCEMGRRGITISEIELYKEATLDELERQYGQKSGPLETMEDWYLWMTELMPDAVVIQCPAPKWSVGQDSLLFRW